MKVWLAVGLAILVGVGVGFGVAWVRLSSYPWTGNYGGENAPLRISRPSQSGGELLAAKAVLESDTHDFGAMDANSTGHHDFVVLNKGNAPLKLTKGETTCKCTLAKVDEAEIPPGGKSKVTLDWTAKSLTGAFRQTATVLTNDPDHPRVTVTVTGRVTAIYRTSPSEVVFSRLAPGETGNASVRLFGYGSEKDLKATGFQLEESTNAKHFDVALRPLSADQIKDEPDAKSGYEVLITLKPGLPIGPFRQKIAVATNLKEAANVDIPIRGEVASEISVAGAEFDPETGVLMLGNVDSSQGAERTVRIFVRGPFCRQVRFEPVEVVPALLRVTVGKTTEMSSGEVTLTPLTIEIPKGSPPANHLGSEQGKLGRITLKTHHPQSPELRIYVRFAVEG